mgnify:CR=1 FL=1
MSEQEKKVLDTIADALPNMSEFDKGYLLGMGEAMAGNKERAECERGEQDEKPERA